MSLNYASYCRFNSPSRFCVTALLSLVVVLTIEGNLGNYNHWLGAPANAQIYRPELVAEEVYKAFPELPRENDYVRVETGEAATDHTLISRLIRYHLYTKDRTPLFRIDWQLTFADYLGAYEVIQEERYPGHQSLSVNPYQKDITAFAQLNRQQRSDLADLLVGLYQPPQQPSQRQPSPEAEPDSPTLAPPQRQRSLSEPGDSDLLKF